MSKRIKVSTIIHKPIEMVWDEVKIMKNHVNWMQDAAKIDFLSKNEAGVDTKMRVLTKVGPFSLNDIITVTAWEEMKSISVVHEGIVTGEGAFYLSKNDEYSTKFEWIEDLKAPIYLGGPIAEFFGGLVLNLIWKKNLINLKKILE
tara:strand:+ start:24 stop:461 length:438 start_codon:yes stop_codon:yes gene_type:complete